MDFDLSTIWIELELAGLLEDAALNWLALDGLWFQAVEKKFGTEEASYPGKTPMVRVF